MSPLLKELELSVLEIGEQLTRESAAKNHVISPVRDSEETSEGSQPMSISSGSPASSTAGEEGGVSLLDNHWPPSSSPTPSPPSALPLPAPVRSSSTSSTDNAAAKKEEQTWAGRTAYENIPHADWNIWRRCCTCHTAYFAAGEHTNVCYCGHEKCEECCWASDFGYAPFW